MLTIAMQMFIAVWKQNAAEDLLAKKTTIVGTLRRNKTEVPSELTEDDFFHFLHIFMPIFTIFCWYLRGVVLLGPTFLLLVFAHAILLDRQIFVVLVFILLGRQVFVVLVFLV
ncbi:hypothetical protein T06_15682 [Trichinella sp. T6]|nr:hypothetical protein T06_15682 [Trichinella sp. T6]